MAEDLLSLSTDELLAGIEEVARTRFDCRTFPQRNLSIDDWALLVRAGVLLPAIPTEHGGRDSHVEMCRVVETLAEWHLPIGMYTKIITAVALRPIALHATEEAKREVLPQFAGRDPMICGFGSAHHYQQLCGGEGYRVGSPTNIAAQAFLDTRVFTIFDGTNDLLSQQLTEYHLARCGDRPLSSHLATDPLTAPAVTVHHLDLRFLDRELRQEHLVLAGRAIAYVFAITQVMRWAQQSGTGAAERAAAAIAFLEADIDAIARELDLLDAGIIGECASGPALPAGQPLSRSIPIPG